MAACGSGASALITPGAGVGVGGEKGSDGEENPQLLLQLLRKKLEEIKGKEVKTSPSCRVQTQSLSLRSNAAAGLAIHVHSPHTHLFFTLGDER